MARNNKYKWILAGGAAAAGSTLYFFDRERGQERRTAFATKAKRLGRELGEAAAKSARDGWHQVAGPAWQAWSAVGRTEWPDDRVLVERIRSRMGRVVAHPHKIHVVSDDGVVTLWGTATDEEALRLPRIVKNVPGVREVVNHLEAHENKAEKDEKDAAPHEISVFKQARQETMLNWSPAQRLAAGIAGAAAVLYGLKRKDSLGVSISVLGAGLATASTLKKNVHSLLAFSEDSPGFEIEKTIRINAPVSDVFEFWANPENYPKVFSHISSIEKLGENLYRWTVAGPGGIPVHWEGTITRKVPNTLVEFKSLPGSTVGNLGFIRVDPNYDASTRVLVRMFYRPPAGILGRVLAEILGVDPKQVLEQDLKRLKLLFEKDEGYMKEVREGGEREILKIAKT
jgi:uncharacterized membrane protein